VPASVPGVVPRLRDQVLTSFLVERHAGARVLDKDVVDECARDVARLVALARGAIGAFDAAHPSQPEADPRQLWPRTHLAQWLDLEVGACGDDDAAARLRAAVAEGERQAPADAPPALPALGLADAMAWGRDKVHALRRVQKELVGRVRSLRYFEAVDRAMATDPAAAWRHAAPPGPPRAGVCQALVGARTPVWPPHTQRPVAPPRARGRMATSCAGRGGSCTSPRGQSP